MRPEIGDEGGKRRESTSDSNQPQNVQYK